MSENRMKEVRASLDKVEAKERSKSAHVTNKIQHKHRTTIIIKWNSAPSPKKIYNKNNNNARIHAVLVHGSLRYISGKWFSSSILLRHSLNSHTPRGQTHSPAHTVRCFSAFRVVRPLFFVPNAFILLKTFIARLLLPPPYNCLLLLISLHDHT